MTSIDSKRALLFRGLLRSLCEQGFQEFDQMGLPTEFWRNEEQSLLAFVRGATRGRPSPGSLALLSSQAGITFGDVPQASCEYWVGEMRQVFLFEQITSGCSEVMEALADGKEGFVEKAKSLLLAAAYKVGQMVENNQPEDLVTEDRITRIFDNLRLKPSIDTPFPFFNNSVGGIRPGELFVFCAMSGVGKTMLLLMMALHAVKKGHRVLFINTEMSNDDLMTRLCNFMAVDTTSWRGRSPSQSDESYIKMQVRGFAFRDRFKAKEYNHHRKLEDLEYDILSVQPDLICVDSAYELQKRKFDNREDHLRKGEIFGDLKDFAKRHNVPILATSQMNQAKTESDDEPKRMLFNQSRVAYSQSIARVSDYTFYLQNVPGDTIKIRVIPAKFRSSARCDFFEIDTSLKTYYFHAPVYEPRAEGGPIEDVPA
jgi:archaellum biogenesis ATPase FlaH